VVPKLLPLIASEAEVVVSSPKNILMDKDTRFFLRELGIRCEDHIDPNEAFDLLLDCTGTYSYLKKINIGAVELTRSGENYYRNTQFSCISVDDSQIKMIETRIGTSDGLIRALKHLNYEIDNKKVLLFGYGKVGKGIYQRLVTENAQVIPVDFIEVFETHHFMDSFIDAEDHQSVQEVAQKSDYIITVTGIKHLIESQYEVSYFKRGSTLINMGAEDEYGPSFADQEILNQKSPLNFFYLSPHS